MWQITIDSSFFLGLQNKVYNMLIEKDTFNAFLPKQLI